MNLLLDTHILLWWLTQNPQLDPAISTLIEHPNTAVWTSAVVIWEIRIKQSLGKLSIPDSFRNTLLNQGFIELPITAEHADHVHTLPLHHRDPFDRLLIAQAQKEKFTLATHDKQFKAYDIKLKFNA